MGLWIWCGNENAVFTVDWKKFAETEKDAAGQVERERHVDNVFLTSRMLCIMNSYIRGKQWIAGIISKCWNFKRKCQERKTSVVEKQLLVPPSWQWASPCIATDSRPFGQHEHNCASSATLLLWPGSGRLFLVFQTEIHHERTTVLDNSRDYGQFADRATYDPKKRHTRTVSRTVNGIGSVASMQEGSTLKVMGLTQLQACPKKL
jgi:hypothetical protein